MMPRVTEHGPRQPPDPLGPLTRQNLNCYRRDWSGRTQHAVAIRALGWRLRAGSGHVGRFDCILRSKMPCASEGQSPLPGGVQQNNPYRVTGVCISFLLTFSSVTGFSALPSSDRRAPVVGSKRFRSSSLKLR
jgi:hypothetical protein